MGIGRQIDYGIGAVLAAGGERLADEYIVALTMPLPHGSEPTKRTVSRPHFPKKRFSNPQVMGDLDAIAGAYRERIRIEWNDAQRLAASYAGQQPRY